MQNHPEEHGMSTDESAAGSETVGVLTYPSDIMSAAWIRSKDRDKAATHAIGSISTGASMDCSESTTVAELTETWGAAHNGETERRGTWASVSAIYNHSTGYSSSGNTKEQRNMSFMTVIASSNEITIATDSRSTMSVPGAEHFVYNDRYQKIVILGDFAVASTGVNNFAGNNLYEFVHDAAKPNGVENIVCALMEEGRKYVREDEKLYFTVAGRENNGLAIQTTKITADGAMILGPSDIGDGPAVRCIGVQSGTDFMKSIAFDASVLRHNPVDVALAIMNTAKAIDGLSAFERQKEGSPRTVPFSVGGDIVCLSMRKTGPWMFMTPKPGYYRG
jgi:hypothetical protein